MLSKTDVTIPNLSAGCVGNSCNFDINITIPNVNITHVRAELQAIVAAANQLKPQLEALEGNAASENAVVQSEADQIVENITKILPKIEGVNQGYAATVAQTYGLRDQLDSLNDTVSCYVNQEYKCVSHTHAPPTTTTPLVRQFGNNVFRKL